MNNMFGKEFMWGVATAAYQIEGGKNADGKKDNIWDVFTHKPNIVIDGSNGDVACDSYNRLDEDLALLQDLGVNAYRFSVSWARVLPDGTGKVNEKGIDYYNRLIDGLLERNITPYLTLYHWDLPQALQEKGGFLNREFINWFLEYTRVIAERFGDRVKHFFTFNEPYTFLGKSFAPGFNYSKREQLKRIHHVLLAHGLAARELHKIPNAKVGWASCGTIPIPASDSKEDYQVALDLFLSVNKDVPTAGTTIYADPIFFGDYPKEYYEYFKDELPDIQDGDMEIISEPLDFWAQNTYDGEYYKAEKDGLGNTIAVQVPRKWGEVITTMGWHMTPKSLYYASKYVYERYKKPVYIAENGIACADFIYSDGAVHDPMRIEYLRLYLDELARAKADGVDVKGYFYWSFLDNFEWMKGYTQRFGLVYIDYENGKRIKKDSFFYYHDYINEGKINR